MCVNWLVCLNSFCNNFLPGKLDGNYIMYFMFNNYLALVICKYEHARKCREGQLNMERWNTFLLKEPLPQIPKTDFFFNFTFSLKPNIIVGPLFSYVG